MQENTSLSQIKPYILKKLKIDSTLSSQNYRKKGHRIVPTLIVGYSDTIYAESVHMKNLRKAKLLEVFKRVKFTRNVDLSESLIARHRIYSPGMLYVAKRLVNISTLSVYDYRERRDVHMGLVACWPKYMKNLEFLNYKIWMEIQNSAPAHSNHQLVAGYDPKKRNFGIDFLRYAPRLKRIQVTSPYYQFSPCLDNIWMFKKYPSSIEKISLCHANYSTDKTLEASLCHLKKLRDLEISLVDHASIKLMTSVCEMISQLPQLLALTLNFVEGFEINASVFEALRGLVHLEKVKLTWPLLKHNVNLEILQSLKDCPLKNLSLRAVIKSDEDVALITNFLKKRKSLESLKLYITKRTLFESSRYLEELVGVIDNLPQLFSLSLSFQTTESIPKKKILPEMNLSFKSLFSKTVLLRKFRISLNQHSFSKEGFMSLVASCNQISLTLEKLQIDVGVYKPKGTPEVDFILDFMRNLKNIRSLKLLSLDVTTKQFFSEMLEAVETLKFLKTFCIGEVSGKITKVVFLEGVEKILLKKGVENFFCNCSADLKKALLAKSLSSPENFTKRIRTRAPHVTKGSKICMFFLQEKGTWIVKNR